MCFLFLSPRKISQERHRLEKKLKATNNIEDRRKKNQDLDCLKKVFFYLSVLNGGGGMLNNMMEITVVSFIFVVLIQHELNGVL